MKRRTFDRLDIEIFRLICELDRTRQFSRTAAVMGLSQPAITQKIALLEQILGKPLWIRHGRRDGEFTQMGQIVCEAARSIIQRIDELEEASRQRDSHPVKLVIGASSTPLHRLLPGVLRDFAVSHPSIEVTIRAGDSQMIEQYLLDGQVDIGLIGRKFGHPDLKSSAVAEDRIVLAVASSLWPGGSRRVTFDDLSRHTILWKEEGSATQEVVIAAMKRAGLTLPEGIRTVMVSGTQSLSDSIRDGLGMGFISESASEGLSVLEVEGLTPIIRRLYVSVISERSTEPAIQAFISMLTVSDA